MLIHPCWQYILRDLTDASNTVACYVQQNVPCLNGHSIKAPGLFIGNECQTGFFET